ncbi:MULTISPECIES: dethiobiotin synthase [unclassified Erwinia]|uniref:dethiobiotin synthase n=1 Tax=unclassified Erwinia TaxID=2622719 RepID=UPI0008349E57|nr:dethiobiotin synthase [Erwinia sp. ErVv1]
MTERWFITGTDTEVGKTVASTALLQAARQAGFRCVGYKPVASGSEITPQGLRNEDALALQKASAVDLPYDSINPMAFVEPTAPHILSAEEGRPIDFQQLSAGLKALTQQANWVLTEGAGGWFTPLTDSATFADWVRAEQLPVVLVVGIKLGCINHALLTAQAILASGLRLAGWIANAVQPPGKRHQEYLTTLAQRLPAPMLGEIPYLTEAEDFEQLGQYVRLPV